MRFSLFRPLLFLLAACMLLAGCAKEPEATENTLELHASTPQTGSVAAPAATAPASASPGAKPSAQMGEGKGLIVEQTVAYAFAGTLYGGVTYRNEGASAVSLTEATFTFSYAGTTHTETFEPFAGRSDVVPAGESASVTLFLPLEGLANVDDISLTAELKAAPTDTAPQKLEVHDERLIQNYPGFATLSGTLRNPGGEASGLNLIYVEFYDEADKLLGVWYFSRNVVLQPQQSTAFVVHLRSLPIEGLAEKTATMRFRALGI